LFESDESGLEGRAGGGDTGAAVLKQGGIQARTVPLATDIDAVLPLFGLAG